MGYEGNDRVQELQALHKHQETCTVDEASKHKQLSALRRNIEDIHLSVVEVDANRSELYKYDSVTQN